jgi:signal transduction histidine kinase
MPLTMEDPTARILAAETPEEVRSIASELAESAAKIEVELSATRRARELLLNSVAHDLRNPLNTFAMSVGLLKDDLERHDLDAARALALVKRMERSTAKMQSLVDDLLEASRVEAGAIELAPRVELAVTIAERAVTAALPVGEERRLRVELGDVDRNVHVKVDLERATQAVGKLIGYVLKFTAEGGVVVVALARRETSVVMTIRNAATARSAASAIDAGRGGLALLIGRGLLEAQDGTVDIDSEGITVTLPSAE